MKSNTAKNLKQYTIRSVPRSVDQALRRRASREKKSLNTVLLEVLQKEAGVSQGPIQHHDLDYLSGLWIKDPAVEQVLKLESCANFYV